MRGPVGRAKPGQPNPFLVLFVAAGVVEGPPASGLRPSDGEGPGLAGRRYRVYIFVLRRPKRAGREPAVRKAGGPYPRAAAPHAFLPPRPAIGKGFRGPANCWQHRTGWIQRVVLAVATAAKEWACTPAASEFVLMLSCWMTEPTRLAGRAHGLLCEGIDVVESWGNGAL